MATRKLPPKDAPEDELLEQPDTLSAEQILAQYFGQASPESVSVAIYELASDRAADRAFLFAFPLASAPPPHELFAEILDKWGPGRYQVYAQYTGDGKIAFRHNFTVGADRDRRRAAIPSRAELKGEDRAAPAATPVSGVSPELAAILAGQNRILEALAESIAQSRAPARDTLEIARELAALKELFGPAPSPAPTASILEIVRDVLKIKDQLAGDDESPLTAAMRTLGPAINRAVERLGPVPSPPVTTGDARNGGGGAMRAACDALLELARSGAPSDVAAQRVLEYLASAPEWVEQAVIALVVEERERAVERLCGLDARLGEYREWLGALVRALLTVLENDSENSQENAGGEASAAQARHAASGHA
jgi:hypothetical protein